MIMSEVKKTTKDNKLEFNTYCFFTEEEKDISQTIGLIFKDYIESLKIKYNCNINISNTLKIPPLSGKNIDAINKLSSSLNLKTSKFNGGCEAGYYEQYSGNAILFGVGDLSMAHKPNECMTISNYYKYNAILLKMIEKIQTII